MDGKLTYFIHRGRQNLVMNIDLNSDLTKSHIFIKNEERNVSEMKKKRAIKNSSFPMPNNSSDTIITAPLKNFS